MLHHQVTLVSCTLTHVIGRLVMLKTGKEHVESLRDGRVVYLGNERIEDVTTHPAFRNAVRTVVALYDMKADPAHHETMTYEEEGGRHAIYYLRPQTRDDLQRRMLGHRKIADLTYGLFGRSPDHVASFVTGMAMKADAPPAAARPSGPSARLLSAHPR
jgi:4-hydroxyphenylacetate 3-monooxygenase